MPPQSIVSAGIAVPERPKLQLALDFADLEQALSVAERAAAHVDWLEAGTPLIKAEGLRAVTALKTRWPDKVVVADMKTMDAGALEAELAFRAGADVMTVLGAAPKETIAAALEARGRGRQVMVDTIGVADLGALAQKIADLDVDVLMVHTGIDQQRAGRSPFADLDKAHTCELRARLAAVGGLTAASVPQLRSYPEVALVIVGGAIANSPDPGAAAAAVRAAVEALTPGSH